MPSCIRSIVYSIVLGGLNGKLDAAFQKLTTLHSKNSFSFAIIAGNLFAQDEDEGTVARLLSGEIKVPLPTYFTVGTTPLPPQVIECVEKDEDVSIQEGQLPYVGSRILNTYIPRSVRTFTSLASAVSTKPRTVFGL